MAVARGGGWGDGELGLKGYRVSILEDEELWRHRVGWWPDHVNVFYATKKWRWQIPVTMFLTTI